MIVKTINFRIGKAEYFLDGKDSSAILILNYAKNTFEVCVKKVGNDINEILLEGEEIARHLLNDKARLNLIERIKRKINTNILMNTNTTNEY